MTYIVPYKKIYYIHIPKSGGTSEYDNLAKDYHVQTVPTGKHSPYSEEYEDYECIYTHVRNPHTRMLSQYLFQYEMRFMYEKFITKERQAFNAKEHIIPFAKWSTKIPPSPIDKRIMEKQTPLVQSPSPENYCRWLYTIRLILKELTTDNFKYRPYSLQSEWLSDKVFVKKIEDEKTVSNITSRMPNHEDQPYLDAAKNLIEEYYYEDFNDFGY